MWLTLGEWDPDTTPLTEWATAAINRDYPALRAPDYGPDTVAELLRRGRITLFLDGLDETPAGVRAKALRRIEEEAIGIRVVLTSRPEEYRLAAHASHLSNTAVIELRPVRAASAAAYLRITQSGANRLRWERLADYVEQNQESVIGRALNNPLMLSLARDAYSSRDPVVLSEPGRFDSADSVREHLIDQLLVAAYPDEQRRGEATAWLAWVARQMGPSRDLSWWEIPTWIPHWKLHLLRGLMVGLSMGAAAAFVAQSVIGLIVGHRVGLVATISVAVLVGVAGGMGPKYGAGLRRPPRIIVPRMLYLRDFSPLVATGILVCLGMALVIGSSTSLVSIVVTRSASRASTGFIVGFVAEITRSSA